MAIRWIVFLMFTLFYRPTIGAGFEDSTKHFMKSEDDRMRAIVGKTFWVYYGREKCKLLPPVLHPEPSYYSSKRFVSNTPAKVYIEDLIVGENEMSKFYKVLINDSETAYEPVLASEFLNLADRLDDDFVQHECVLSIPPNEMDIRMEKINAKTRNEEKLNAKFEAEADARQKRPGAKIGMTKKQVINKTSWGAPDSINKTTTAHGSQEQWVYGDNNYLYFTNGKLTAIQN